MEISRWVKTTKYDILRDGAQKTGCVKNSLGAHTSPSCTKTVLAVCLSLCFRRFIAAVFALVLVACSSGERAYYQATVSPEEVERGSETTLAIVTDGDIDGDEVTVSDPRLFIETAGTYYLEVQPQSSTSGFYAVSFRPLVVINEIDNRTSSAEPFVELVGPGSFDLSGYELCAYDSSCAPVDSANECVSLAGFTTSSAGYEALYHDDFGTATTLALPAGAGAVVLKEGATVIDSVQYGTISGGCYTEGTQAEVGETRTIGRGAEVDTNDNQMDFIYMAGPTPGQPNDRTCQAAVPLFGENAG